MSGHEQVSAQGAASRAEVVDKLKRRQGAFPLPTGGGPIVAQSASSGSRSPDRQRQAFEEDVPATWPRTLVT